MPRKVAGAGGCILTSLPPLHDSSNPQPLHFSGPVTLQKGSGVQASWQLWGKRVQADSILGGGDRARNLELGLGSGCFSAASVNSPSLLHGAGDGGWGGGREMSFIFPSTFAPLKGQPVNEHDCPAPTPVLHPCFIGPQFPSPIRHLIPGQASLASGPINLQLDPGSPQRPFCVGTGHAGTTALCWLCLGLQCWATSPGLSEASQIRIRGKRGAGLNAWGAFKILMDILV